MLLYLFLAFIIFEILLAVFLILFYIEVGITFFRKTAPELPSGQKLRDAVIAEIRSRYPDAGTAVDIGSGWGGMARRMAREFPKMQVTGIELMPLSFACSWLARLFFGPRNCRLVRGDVVRYLSKRHNNAHPGRCAATPPAEGNSVCPAGSDNSPPQEGCPRRGRGGLLFDIAVCYSGVQLMKAIAPLADRFGVLISLDFPLPNTKATRTIKLHKDKLGQHMLYVYEGNKA